MPESDGIDGLRLSISFFTQVVCILEVRDVVRRDKPVLTGGASPPGPNPSQEVCIEFCVHAGDRMVEA